MKNLIFRFTLKLRVDEWGSLKRGDIGKYWISMDSLVYNPIDDRWEIICCDQWTGHKDKNGKMICNNDTVKHKYRRIWQTNEHISKVVWNQKFSCYYLDSGSAQQQRMRDDVIYEIVNLEK